MQLFVLMFKEDDFPPEAGFMGIFSTVDKAKSYVRENEWAGVTWEQDYDLNNVILENHWTGYCDGYYYNIEPAQLDPENE